MYRRITDLTLFHKPFNVAPLNSKQGFLPPNVMENLIPSYLRFVPGRALPCRYRLIARALSHFYYSSIDLVDERGQPVSALDDGTPTILLASHRNGAADGWVISQLMPQAQFLTAVQLLRSRFLRLLFTGIPVVRDKDRQRYGFTRAQAGNPLLHAIAHVRQGGSLVIFPEGTSEWSTAPQPYQAGAVKIVQRLLLEGYTPRIIAVGSFYQAPEVFGSHVELMVSDPVSLPARGNRSLEGWEAEISRSLTSTLDRVSVNCPDKKTFFRAQRYALQSQLHGDSFAQAFKRGERGDVALPAEQTVKTGIWHYAMQIPFLLTLLPVLLCAWLAGRQADGRNTIAFFRLAAGFAMGLLWLPYLAFTGIAYPGLCLLYLAAFLGWRQRSVWGKGKL